MKRILLVIFTMITMVNFSWADGQETARLQVIHNAADPLAEMVDVYVNEELFLDDFKFRTATPYVDVPAEVTLNIGVAPASSASKDDIIATIPVKLQKGKTYVAVANGVLDPSSFAKNPDGREIGFTIFAKEDAREKGARLLKTDFIVVHGSTDAPEVDILVEKYSMLGKMSLASDFSDLDLPTIETYSGIYCKLIDDVAYGDISDYKRLYPKRYKLHITPAEDNNTIVASFKADLSGLAGGAAVVFASGFLTPDMNNNGPAFGLFAALPDGNVVAFEPVMMPKPMARLQVIHNAADPLAEMVDVYVNEELFLDNFKFRTATPYVDVPAEVMLNIGVAPASSSSKDDIIATIPVKLQKGKTYVAVANGVLDPSSFAANPDGREIGFTIFAKEDAREKGKYDEKIDFFVLHGSTDAPTVDVIARDVAKLVDDAAYGDITDYIRVRPKAYTLDITPGNDNHTIVASFKADLSGLAGGAAVVFASGFLTPDMNNNGPAFGLFAALPDGNVVAFEPVMMPKPMARLQVIHNAADPLAEMVDVYVNEELFLDNFKFRTATPYVDVPAEVMLNIGVAPASSSSKDDIIATIPVKLQKGKTYVAVANGVLDPSSFAANPDGREIGFTIFAKEDAREKGKYDEKIDFFVLHGSTDAPTVDVIARDVAKLVDDAAYGDITDYIRVRPKAYTLDITPGNDNHTIVASFKADLSGLAGGAAVVFASGFLTPDMNNNGPAFGLFAALPDGNVVAFEPVMMPKPMARLQVIHNAADPLAEMVDVYVNEELFLDNFKFRTATPYVDVPAEVMLNIGVAPASSSSKDDIIATIPVKLQKGKTYVAVANGVLDPSSFAANPDGREIGFTIFAKEDAREGAKNEDQVDFFVLHGVTDAPKVNLLGVDISAEHVGYGDISEYISVAAQKNWIIIYTPEPALTLVGVYTADLTGLDGNSAVVFASGFLSPADNNNGLSFAIFAALSDGSVVEFSAVTSQAKYEVIADIMGDTDFGNILALENLGANGVVSDYNLAQNYPNPFNPTTKISFSLPESRNVSLKVFDTTGRIVATLLENNMPAGNHQVQFDAANFASGMYFYRIEAGSYSAIKSMILVK